MGARGSIPVQMLDGFAENTLFATEPLRLDGVDGAVGGLSSAQFAPFTGSGEDVVTEGGIASERSVADGASADGAVSSAQNP